MALRALEEAFAGSDIHLPKRPAPSKPNRIPDWVAVDFSAEHGDYDRLSKAALQRLDEAGLAGEFKPEGACW